PRPHPQDGRRAYRDSAHKRRTCPTSLPCGSCETSVVWPSLAPRPCRNSRACRESFRDSLWAVSAPATEPRAQRAPGCGTRARVRSMQAIVVSALLSSCGWLPSSQISYVHRQVHMGMEVRMTLYAADEATA